MHSYMDQKPGPVHASANKAKVERVEQKTEGQSLRPADGNQRFAKLREWRQEASRDGSEETVKLLHYAILALGEACDTSITSANSSKKHALLLFIYASSSILLSHWPHLYMGLVCARLTCTCVYSSLQLANYAETSPGHCNSIANILVWTV